LAEIERKKNAPKKKKKHSQTPSEHMADVDDEGNPEDLVTEELQYLDFDTFNVESQPIMEILKPPKDIFLNSKSKPIRDTLEVTTGVSYCEEVKTDTGLIKNISLGG
jgi:hypothetical protein